MMDKQNVVNPYHGILFSLLKEENMNPTTWMNLELTPREISQSQKDKYCMISLM